jgi:tyrosine-protein kinase Etk/Wzc
MDLLAARGHGHVESAGLAALSGHPIGRNGALVHGIVLNDVRLDRGLGRRNAYHYQYRYG